MSTYQKVILLGHVGRDPEVKYTSAGTAVVSLSLATSRRWKDKNSGEQQEDTEWHRVVAYDRLAEIIGEYVIKGSSLLIDGRLKTRKWQDKDGVDRYTTEVVVENLQLQGKASGDREEKPQRQAPQRDRAPAKGSGSTGFDDMDDDIPF